VDTLRKDSKPEYGLPIPEKLPVALEELHHCGHLMEDVWLHRTPSKEAPAWIREPNIRQGIRSVLKIQRCKEEEWRVNQEARNMLHWYEHEVTVLETASLLPECKFEFLTA
jgi:hypothetical protein